MFKVNLLVNLFSVTAALRICKGLDQPRSRKICGPEVGWKLAYSKLSIKRPVLLNNPV